MRFKRNNRRVGKRDSESKNRSSVSAREVMAAPGAGLGTVPPHPSVQFFLHQQQDYNNTNPYHYPHTHPPPLAPPPSVGPPYLMAPVAPPLGPLPTPQNNNNKKQTHSRHHSNNNQKERVRTLFISGLPEDIKHREIYNLFRRRPGFEACQLKYTGRGYQIVAFAVFSHQQLALAAKDALNGVRFDPETGATLHIELARANSRITRSGTDDGGNGLYDKRISGPVGVPAIFDDDGLGETMKMPGSSDIVQSGGAMGASMAGEGGKSGAAKEQPRGPGDNPPCPTLFVANLGPACTEDELRQVLSRFRGFKMLKMQTKGGMPVAFVDFEDVTSSGEALKQLQGTWLPSSDRGGLHLEYAKSRMRYPRQDKVLENEMKQVFPFSFCDEA